MNGTREAHPADDELRTFLGGRDIRCPVCEHNLRGLEKSACPECGLVFSAADVRGLAKARWFEQMCLTGAVFGVLACVAWVVAIVATMSDPLWPIALWVPGLAGALLLPCGLSWLSLRRRYPLRRARLALWHGVIMWTIAMAWLVPLLLLAA